MGLLSTADKILRFPADILLTVGTAPTLGMFWLVKKAFARRADAAPVPAVGPAAPDTAQLEKEYAAKVNQIDRLPLSEDEKRDAKTAAEVEYLKKMEQLTC